MIFKPTPLLGSYEIELAPFIDDRGWFGRYYCKNEFLQIGHSKEWVQLNHSMTNKKGSIRGMHFQISPYSEIKMVKCIVGSVWDVIIDLRSTSPTFLKWFGLELSAENKKMIYIPEGFGHGFQTLADCTELIYHHTEFYKPDMEDGIRYNDPVINIEWPLEVTSISMRDQKHALLNKQFKGI